MSIADKLTAIAQNQQRVYDAGYAKGQAEGGGGGGNDLLKALSEGTVEEINDDTITSAKQYMFAYSPLLKIATLNSLTTANASIFLSCPMLETVNLPNLTVLPYTGFATCPALKNVYAPNAIGAYGVFNGCSSLEFIDLPKLHYMNDYFFANCGKLKTVILRHSAQVMTLENVRAFANTPFRNGEGGTIYVPQALVESFKTATNWNALESTTFLPIEGSEYE